MQGHAGESGCIRVPTSQFVCGVSGCDQVSTPGELWFHRSVCLSIVRVVLIFNPYTNPGNNLKPVTTFNSVPRNPFRKGLRSKNLSSYILFVRKNSVKGRAGRFIICPINDGEGLYYGDADGLGINNSFET